MGTLISNTSAQDTIRGNLSENRARIIELESQLLAAQTQVKNYSNNPPLQSPAVDKKMNETNNELKKTIKELKDTLVKRQGELDNLKRTSQEATNNLVAAKQIAGTLGNILNVASNPTDISLLKKVEEIANAVKEKRDAQLGKNSPFNELYNNFKTSSQNDISSVCYLTYFVKFFINNIFKDDIELYKDLNLIIDEYLNTDSDIDGVMENLKYILESVEGDKTRGVGCYILNKEPIKILDNLYKKMNENPEINERCTKALNYLFKNYNRSDVYYIPKGVIGESEIMQPFTSMFYIRPFKKTEVKINLYDTSGNIINDTKISTDKIFKNTSLPYATIFIFYILFSRKYLLVREDKQGCPLPESLKSESLQITKGKVTHAATVKN
jgi:DNA repair exonuclease SbcCD ATPase subunit